MGNSGEAVLNRKFMEMRKLLNNYLAHFPRDEKYALCMRIKNTADDMYDLITECQKRYHKKTTMTNLDITHQKLRMQLYLAHELGYLGYKNGKHDVAFSAQRRFMIIERIVDEIGRLIGAWISSEKKKGNF